MSAKLVMGNWKMHGSLDANRQLLAAMLQDHRINRAGVALAAPMVYLPQLAALLRDSPIALAAQDVSRFGTAGAYTGEVSAAMLADVGCQYALVGHSERRQYHAEGNPQLAAKLAHSCAAGLTPVLCVGETLAEREAGQHLAVIRRQLEIVATLNARQLLVAYEPVWAIGTGRVASLGQIREMHDCIKEACLQSQKGSDTMRVLYGGSVKADNAEAVLSIESVDGALVGGASLDVDSFGMICLAADKLV